jgi:hypothetical protein
MNRRRSLGNAEARGNERAGASNDPPRDRAVGGYALRRGGDGFLLLDGLGAVFVGCIII